MGDFVFVFIFVFVLQLGGCERGDFVCVFAFCILYFAFGFGLQLGGGESLTLLNPFQVKLGERRGLVPVSYLQQQEGGEVSFVERRNM